MAKKIEQVEGVWIVYDLEANREIQKLLIEKKFAFLFLPSTETFSKWKQKKNGNK